MMYQGMDLSRFKKIASDGEVSTLRHNRGHEVKIAHSGLSPKMREHLDGMPVHMAEGGDPMAIDPESPAPAVDAPAEAPSPPPKPAVMPVAGTVDVVASPRRAPTTPEELDNEAALYADDLARGHIKPQTMSGLFAKKDTMGKVGTMFGLLLGGMGSGMTGQPNALLAMMQKEIDNDLEAQKASNTNSQNWLKLSHEHEMQKAQLKKFGVENAFTRAKTEAVPSEIAQNEAHTVSLHADAELKSYEAAKTRMQLAMLHNLGITVDKMPPGPNKDSAANALQNVLSPAVTQDIKQRNAKTAAKIDLRSAARGDVKKEAPAENGSGVDLQKMNALLRQGAAASSLGMAGVGGMSPQQGSVATEEAAHVAQNRAISKMFVDAFNRLDQSYAAGRLNPVARDAEIASLGAQIAKSTTGNVSDAEFKRIVGTMFPDVADWGKARDAKFRHGIELFKTQEAGTPTLDQFQLKTPFPTYARARTKGKGTAAAAAGPEEGTKGTSKSGKPTIFSGGKWIYAK